MTEKKTLKLNRGAKRRGTGVHRLADLRARCDVDPVLGCWHWQGHLGTPGSRTGSSYRFPQVGIARLVLCNPKRITMNARRAAWLLAGNEAPEGHPVYRCCAGGELCINPKHSALATPEEWREIRSKAEDRRCRVDVIRNVHAIAARRALSREKFDAVCRDLASDEKPSLTEIGRRNGISTSLVITIRDGRHWHQRPTKLVRGASVFALAA